MASNNHLRDDCLFCKIIRGEIPSRKLAETEKSYAFLDINPLSKGHALVIPKHHEEFVHQLPDDYLADILPLAKKVANALIEATEVNQYNLLQNNGPMAHQVVKHVHFHIIPKPDEEQGLGVVWPQQQLNEGDASALQEKIKTALAVDEK